MKLRAVRAFCVQKARREAVPAPEVPGQSAEAQRIHSLLSVPELIDLDEKRLFRGNLVICPTPLGNLKDLTIRAIEALNAADVIACEDTRMTGKLLYLLRTRDFGSVVRDCQLPADLSAEYEPDEELLAARAPARPVHDWGLSAAEGRKHPNTLGVRRDKAKMRDAFQAIDLRERVAEGQRSLDRLGSLGFLAEYQRQAPEALHDSTRGRAFRPDEPGDETYGLEDPYVRYIKARVYESKLKRKRGLLISCHAFNEEERVENLLKLVRAGLTVLLVSDAGSPGISDPGMKLVQAARAQRVRVEALPGASAVTLALSLAGFPADAFVFAGYFPKERKEQEQRLREYMQSGKSLVFFENKHRLLATLALAQRVLGDQQAFVGVEITKLHERSLRGRVSQIYEALNRNPDLALPALKGEITVVLAPYAPQFNAGLAREQPEGAALQEEEDAQPAEEQLQPVSPLRAVAVLDKHFAAGAKELSAISAELLGISKTQAYRLVITARKAAPPPDPEDDLEP